MNEHIEIQIAGSVNASIRPPGSKSITNRALVCAALAEGTSTLRGALNSEDTGVMVDALHRLGIRVDHDSEQDLITVNGCGGRIPAPQADLYVANSGTTIRFLTALLTLGHGKYRLDGNERMRQRPIGDLLSALQQLGATVTSENENDCPPVIVNADGLIGGRATVGGDISSQYLSGLLMIAPYAESDVELVVEGNLVSQPYVRMTVKVMAAFGVTIADDVLSHITIRAGQSYRWRDYEVEPDASAASYFWGAAAVTGGTALVQGLGRDAIQGDVAFCDCLEQMGCQVDYHPESIRVSGGKLRGIEVDMNSISDTVQTLAVVALFAEGSTTITGVSHIRHKETDRIGDLARELRRLGAEVVELEDGLKIIPRPLHSAELETYDDHRMAMSLALAGLRTPGVIIKDPSCTAKTYPHFFDDLKSFCAQ